jgi:hypothetical protein
VKATLSPNELKTSGYYWVREPDVDPHISYLYPSQSQGCWVMDGFDSTSQIPTECELYGPINPPTWF